MNIKAIYPSSLALLLCFMFKANTNSFFGLSLFSFGWLKKQGLKILNPVFCFTFVLQ